MAVFCIIIVVACVLISAFPAFFGPLFGGILAIFIIAFISSAISSVKEKRNAQRIEQEKIESLKRQRMERRDSLIDGRAKVEYQPTLPIISRNDDIYEEKIIKEAFNKYLKLKNEKNRIDQHNSFVKSAKKELTELNAALGYEAGDGIERIPALLGEIHLNRIFLEDNFSQLYQYFSRCSAWKKFLLSAKKVELVSNRNFFVKNSDHAFIDFFYGYDIGVFEADVDEFLYFSPCYVIKINISKRMLKVIKYQELLKTFSDYEKTFSSGEYSKFVRILEKYASIFEQKDNANFFKNNFSLTEQEKREKLEEERLKILSERILDFHKKSLFPEFKSSAKNKEEVRINKALFEFFVSKKKNEDILAYNEKIKKLKTRLNEINQVLGYSKNQDFDKLPQEKCEIPIQTIDDVFGNFEKVRAFFASKQEWKDFIEQLSECSVQQGQKLLSRNQDLLCQEFFNNRKIPSISFDDELLLLFFSCYAVLVQKEEFRIIPYDRIKVESKYKEECKRPHRDKDGIVVRKEYTYKNKDGTPDRRRKINPVLYVTRYYSICFSFKNHKRTIPCVDAEKVVQLFENYSKVFLDETNAYILENVFKKEDPQDVSALVKEYKLLKQAEKEKAEKKAALEATRKERERKAREEETRLKNLAIIQRQKEKNEERLRQKKIKENALKFFDVEEVTAENEQTTVTSAIVLTEVFSVLSKPVITNNIFKVELKQIGEMDCAKFDIVFVDMNESIISHKKTVETAAVGQISTVGIVLLSNIDFTKIKKCFMWIIANGEVIEKKPFEMNISFYSDF